MKLWNEENGRMRGSPWNMVPGSGGCDQGKEGIKLPFVVMKDTSPSRLTSGGQGVMKSSLGWLGRWWPGRKGILLNQVEGCRPHLKIGDCSLGGLSTPNQEVWVVYIQSPEMRLYSGRLKMEGSLKKKIYGEWERDIWPAHRRHGGSNLVRSSPSHESGQDHATNLSKIRQTEMEAFLNHRHGISGYSIS